MQQDACLKAEHVAGMSYFTWTHQERSCPCNWIDIAILSTSRDIFAIILITTAVIIVCGDHGKMGTESAGLHIQPDFIVQKTLGKDEDGEEEDEDVESRFGK